MITERTHYFAKPGKRDEVLAARRRACEVRVSIGIAVSVDPSDEPEAIVRHADAAMYRAKKAGGRQASD